MRLFVLGWKKLGHEKRLGAFIVNYADNLVICCRGRAEEALAAMRVMMTKLKLTVNESKTRVSKLSEEKFDFLGYTFGRCYLPKTGRTYLGTVPAKKQVIRICQAIGGETERNKTQLDHKTVVTKLNQMMNGCANYFCLGPVSKAYRAADRHTCKRLRHSGRRHQPIAVTSSEVNKSQAIRGEQCFFSLLSVAIAILRNRVAVAHRAFPSRRR
jgi:hypothetical protein